jgi:hypothetical protein
MQTIKSLVLIAATIVLHTTSGVSQAQLATTPTIKAPTGNMALKGPIKLDPSAPIANLPAAPSRDGLDQAYDRFRRAHENTVAARNRFAEVRDACMVRSFSIDDQRQAGCSPSDAVWECNRKLGNWCTRNASQNWRAANRIVSDAGRNLKEAIDAYTNAARTLSDH